MTVLREHELRTEVIQDLKADLQTHALIHEDRLIVLHAEEPMCEVIEMLAHVLLIEAMQEMTALRAHVLLIEVMRDRKAGLLIHDFSPEHLRADLHADHRVEDPMLDRIKIRMLDLPMEEMIPVLQVVPRIHGFPRQVPMDLRDRDPIRVRTDDRIFAISREQINRFLN